MKKPINDILYSVQIFIRKLTIVGDSTKFFSLEEISKVVDLRVNFTKHSFTKYTEMKSKPIRISLSK